MKGKNKKEWIEKAYQLVATNGFNHINIELLAQAVNKSKSSFYHYFGDWEGFERALLEQHESLAQSFALEALKCEAIIPDMLDLFLDHKADILFHKQLRVHRTKPAYKKCFQRVYQLFEEAILEKWTAFLKLDHQPFLAAKILGLISENFLLQITEENFTYEWLEHYINDVLNLMLDINQQHKS